MSVLVAIVLAIAAAIALAYGSVLQHMSISRGRRPGRGDALSLHEIRELLQRPWWLLGLALIVGGTALHVTALSLAPMTVVQPVGVLAVPCAVLMASKSYGYRPSASVWVAVSATTLGIVGFTALSARFSGVSSQGIDTVEAMAAVAACCAIGGALAAGSRVVPEALRSLALAAGGAVFLGLTSALTKTMLLSFKLGDGPLSPTVVLSLLGTIGACAVGGWLVQQAHAVGYPEVVVGSLTTIDPLVAVVYGLVVLDEGLRLDTPAIVALALCGAVAALGVAGLSRYHPEARRRGGATVPAHLPPVEQRLVHAAGTMPGQE